MANQFDTSFIPQQPLLRVEGVRGHHEPLNFALVLSLIIFFVVLITAGGIYFYSNSIDARNYAHSDDLAQLEKTLDGSKIAEYKGIELRIANAKKILTEHHTFSPVLALLEGSAADNVGLTEITFDTMKENPVINVEAMGPTYQSVNFQLETWRHISPMVLGVELKEMSLDDTTGLVLFSAQIGLKTDIVKYTNAYKSIESARNEESNSSAELSVSSEVKTQTP